MSTQDQNLQRQIDSTDDYARSKLDGATGEIHHYLDKSTGTNTKRDGYRDLMAAVEGGEIQHVVVHEISRMARSLHDLERTVRRVTEAGAKIHFVRDNLTFGNSDDSPMHKLQLQMLGAFAEWEAEVKRQNTVEGIAARQSDPSYAHGRPPLGYDKDDGRLVEGEDFHRVCAVLDMVAKGDLSNRKAAEELGCGRATIRRALERSELYGL